jgi:hypothetical protein
MMIPSSKTRRRGVSQILGSLFMLAIVGGIGSVILFQGMSGINSFNSSLMVFDAETREAARESLVIAHVRFHDNGGNDDVTLWVRNTGTIDVTIDRVTIVKADTQHLILDERFATSTPPTVPVKEVTRIPSTGSLDTSLGEAPLSTNWSAVQSTKFIVTVTTVRGSSFEVTALPFNT